MTTAQITTRSATSSGYRFTASRGGHAPGHLRDAFLACVEEWAREHKVGPWWQALATDDVVDFWNPDRQAWWDALSAEERGAWLAGQLWNCTDTMPGEECRELDLPVGSSYAQAVRDLRRREGREPR